MGTKKQWSQGVVEAISDTLVAYLTIQARTGMSPSYSEYLLYDPVVRVCRARGWDVRVELPLPKSRPGRGDNKRIDFQIREHKNNGLVALIELKYCKSLISTVDVRKDVAKLRALQETWGKEASAFVLIAGRNRRLPSRETAPVSTKPVLSISYHTAFVGAATTFGATAFVVP